jgi:hypothetical protein
MGLLGNLFSGIFGKTKTPAVPKMAEIPPYTSYEDPMSDPSQRALYQALMGDMGMQANYVDPVTQRYFQQGDTRIAESDPRFALLQEYMGDAQANQLLGQVQRQRPFSFGRINPDLVELQQKYAPIMDLINATQGRGFLNRGKAITSGQETGKGTWNVGEGQDPAAWSYIDDMSKQAMGTNLEALVANMTRRGILRSGATMGGAGDIARDVTLANTGAKVAQKNSAQAALQNFLNSIKANQLSAYSAAAGGTQTANQQALQAYNTQVAAQQRDQDATMGAITGAMSLFGGGGGGAAKLASDSPAVAGVVDPYTGMAK